MQTAVHVALAHRSSTLAPLAGLLLALVGALPGATAAELQPGLACELYVVAHDLPFLPRIPDDARPAALRIEARIDHGAAWRDTLPHHDRVVVRWRGVLRVAIAGSYAFALDADDGARCSVGERLVAVAGRQWDETAAAPSLELSTGEHPIQVVYVQDRGGVRCRLRWRRPGQQRLEPVPAEALWHDPALRRDDADPTARIAHGPDAPASRSARLRDALEAAIGDPDRAIVALEGILESWPQPGRGAEALAWWRYVARRVVALVRVEALALHHPLVERALGGLVDHLRERGAYLEAAGLVAVVEQAGLSSDRWAWRAGDLAAGRGDSAAALRHYERIPLHDRHSSLHQRIDELAGRNVAHPAGGDRDVEARWQAVRGGDVKELPALLQADALLGTGATRRSPATAIAALLDGAQVQVLVDPVDEAALQRRLGPIPPEWQAVAVFRRAPWSPSAQQALLIAARQQLADGLLDQARRSLAELRHWCSDPALAHEAAALQTQLPAAPASTVEVGSAHDPVVTDHILPMQAPWSEALLQSLPPGLAQRLEPRAGSVACADGIVVASLECLALLDEQGSRWQRDSGIRGAIGHFSAVPDPQRLVVPVPVTPRVASEGIFCRWASDWSDGLAAGLACFARADGTLRWHSGEDPAWATLSPTSDPVFAGPRGWVLAVDRGRAVDRAIHLVCFDVLDGRQRWHRRLTPLLTLPVHWSDPRGRGREGTVQLDQGGNHLGLIDGLLYAVTGSGVVCCCDARDGHLRWSHAYERRSALRLDDLAELHGGPPQAFGEAVVVAPRDHSGVLALDREDGTPLWRQALAPSARILGRSGPLLALADQRYLAVLDATQGQVRWFGERGNGPLAADASGLHTLDGEALLVRDFADGRVVRRMPVADPDGIVGLHVDDGRIRLLRCRDSGAAAARAVDDDAGPLLRRRWHRPLANPELHAPAARAGVTGHALAVGSGLLTWLRCADGTARWRRLVAPGDHSVAWGPGLCLLQYEQRWCAYDLDDGRRRWQLPLAGNLQRQLPAGAGQLLWSEEDRELVLGLLDLPSGQWRWRRRFDRHVVPREAAFAWDGEHVHLLGFRTRKEEAFGHLVIDGASGADRHLGPFITDRDRLPQLALVWPHGCVNADHRLRTFTVGADHAIRFHGDFAYAALLQRVDGRDFRPHEWWRPGLDLDGELLHARFHSWKTQGDHGWILPVAAPDAPRPGFAGGRLRDGLWTRFDDDGLLLRHPDETGVRSLRLPPLLVEQRRHLLAHWSEDGEQVLVTGCDWAAGWHRPQEIRVQRFAADGRPLAAQTLAACGFWAARQERLEDPAGKRPVEEWRATRVLRHAGGLLLSSADGLHGYVHQDGVTPPRPRIVRPERGEVAIDGRAEASGDLVPPLRLAHRDGLLLLTLVESGGQRPAQLRGLAGPWWEIGLRVGEERHRWGLAVDRHRRSRWWTRGPHPLPTDLRAAVDHDLVAERTCTEVAIPIGTGCQRPGLVLVRHDADGARLSWLGQMPAAPAFVPIDLPELVLHPLTTEEEASAWRLAARHLALAEIRAWIDAMLDQGLVDGEPLLALLRRHQHGVAARWLLARLRRLHGDGEAALVRLRTDSIACGVDLALLDEPAPSDAEQAAWERAAITDPAAVAAELATVELGDAPLATNLIEAALRLHDGATEARIALVADFIRRRGSHPAVPRLLQRIRALLPGDQATASARMATLMQELGLTPEQRYTYGRLQAARGGLLLRDWQLLGPFPLPEESDPLHTSLPVDGQAIDTARSHPVADGVLEWRAIAAGAARVDLADAMRAAPATAAAYAGCWLRAPRAGVVVLELDCTDSCQLWLNGQELHRHRPLGTAAPREPHRIRLFLRSGLNQLLLKLGRRRQAWGFTAELIAADGSGPPPVEALAEEP